MSEETHALKMWSDGGSRGNPGDAAIGVVIQDEHDAVVFETGQYLGTPISNNQAEYQALLYGLHQAANMGATAITCSADSKLIVEQINGRYKVKDAGLQVLHKEALQVLKLFKAWEVRYVPRSENSRADALVNLALDQQAQN